MADAAHMLDGLRPMHLPAGDDGLLSVALLIGLGCGLALWLWPLLSRRHGVRRAALSALAQADALPVPEKRAAQARLLRQIVRTLAGDAAARCEGADWLACLDRVFATRFFSAGAGSCFAHGLYQRPMAADAARDTSQGRGQGGNTQSGDAIDATLACLLARVQR